MFLMFLIYSLVCLSSIHHHIKEQCEPLPTDVMLLPDHCQHTCSYRMTAAAAVVQVEVHINFRNERTIDWCTKEGIHVTAYAPLSSPQTMSSQKKSVPNLLEVSHVCTSCDLLLLVPWHYCRTIKLFYCINIVIFMSLVCI